MTEEIIIDGVNVAECGYFCEADNECSICGMGTDGEDTFCKNCKDNSNCYYKQLKRLEQENKEPKEEIQILKKDSYTRLRESSVLDAELDEVGVMNNKYRSALEEIRGLVSQQCTHCLVILDKVNEVLNGNRE